MPVLCWDTETQGLPEWGKPSEDPCQPHLVQLAAILFDPDTRDEIEAINLIVKPDGWIIPDEVAAIHGITMERAMDEGIAENDVVAEFKRLHAMADRITAYGIDFDMRIMRIAMLRSGMTKPECDDLAKAKPQGCIMRACTPICKLPPTDRMMAAGRLGYKTPSLTEAHVHFFGVGFDGAHDAMADVRAAMKIGFALRELL